VDAEEEWDAITMCEMPYAVLEQEKGERQWPLTRSPAPPAIKVNKWFKLPLAV